MRKSLLMALFGALLAAAAVAATALAVGGPAAAAQTAQAGGMPMGAGMRMGPDGRMEMVAQQTRRRPPERRCRPGSGKVRTYYIAADEMDWDYAPQRQNLITGEPFGDTESVFVQAGPDRIGARYKKALYREYTDASVHDAQAAPGRAGSTSGMLGPGDPRRGRRHHPRRLQEQHAVPGQRAPARRLLRQGLRRRALQRRHLAAPTSRRRRRRPAATTPTCGGARARRPRARWTAAR